MMAVVLLLKSSVYGAIVAGDAHMSGLRFTVRETVWVLELCGRVLF